MNLQAYKMDGLGNDFVIIDQRIKNIDLARETIVKICDRNNIGCDQLIVIKKNRELDVGLEFYNADGSRSGACGNGTRCVAYLLSKENSKDTISVWTESGILISDILQNNFVSTKIGIAKTQWHEIPLREERSTKNIGFKILDNNNNEFRCRRTCFFSYFHRSIQSYCGNSGNWCWCDSDYNDVWMSEGSFFK